MTDVTDVPNDEGNKRKLNKKKAGEREDQEGKSTK